MSSDVLEHVEPEDVEASILELSRVASVMLVLKISRSYDIVDHKQITNFNYTRDTKRKTWDQSKADEYSTFDEDLPNTLHPTVKSSDWWIRQFERLGGWKVHSRLPVPHKRPWLCCSFVMRRDAPPTGLRAFRERFVR